MIAIGETRYELAGFWVRFGAVLIDGIVQGIVATMIFVVLGFAFIDWELIEAGAEADASFGAGFAFAQLVSTLFGAGYYWWGYARGATLGKQALGLRIVREDGSRPGIGYGFARLVGTWVSGIALGLGYLWMVWDAKKQTWHDKMAGTFVVRGG